MNPPAGAAGDPHGPVAADVYDVATAAAGPEGSLPLTDALLRSAPSGDLFGLSQNVGMGWDAAGSADPQYLILSTQGGLRAPDGAPVALGYHTGHWEIGLLVEAAARELRRLGTIPFAGACSDPCDGRTQGTTGMFDSLPYRNDAAGCCAAWRGRCRCAGGCSGSPPATRGCRRCSWPWPASAISPA